LTLFVRESAWFATYTSNHKIIDVFSPLDRGDR
jgi:hypothetical protein